MNDSSHRGSITQILDQMHLEAAQCKIFNRYFEKLDRMATDRLGAFHRVEDGEDIAVRTMAELFEMAQGGYLRAKQIDNRHKLFALLQSIAARRAINEVKKQNRLKRTGGKRVLNEVDVQDDSDPGNLLDNCESSLERLKEVGGDDLEGQLDEVMELVEQFEGRTRSVVSLSLLGLTNRQIAAELGVAVRTIDREKDKIRSTLGIAR